MNDNIIDHEEGQGTDIGFEKNGNLYRHKSQAEIDEAIARKVGHPAPYDDREELMRIHLDENDMYHITPRFGSGDNNFTLVDDMQ